MKTIAKKPNQESAPHSTRPFFSKSGEGDFFSASKSEEKPFFSQSTIQAQLTIGQPDDQYEQEADTVADEVVQKLSTSHTASLVQRACNDCEQEDAVSETSISKLDKSSIQTSGGDDQPSENFENQLNHSKGNSSPLPEKVRTKMEGAFNADFQSVRIHTGQPAVQMSEEIGAEAFTHGNDIYFNKNRYKPENHDGKKLLAHELTHTIQQNGKVQRKTSPLEDKEEKGAQIPPSLGAAIFSTISRMMPVLMKPMVPQIQMRANLKYAPSGLPCALMDTAGVPGVLNVMFGQNETALSPANQLLVENFVGTWVGRGLSDDLDVGGYASTEGPQSTNWRLSCERAQAVRGEMESIGVPSGKISSWGHGETSDFDATALEPNRRATVDFTPGTGPTVNPVLTPFDNFSGRSTTRYGLAESIWLDYNALPHINAAEHFGVNWNLVAGTGTLLGGTFPNYTAGNTPATEQLELVVSTGPATGTRLLLANVPIIAPSRAYMVQIPSTGLCHTTGTASVGFRGNVFMQPSDVSFNNIQWREGTGTGIGLGVHRWENGAVHAVGSWMTIAGGNVATGNQVNTFDTVSSSDNTPDWSLFGGTDWTGMFLWPIQWQYQAPGGPIVTFMTAFHLFVTDKAGNAFISKAGAGPFSRALADPTSTVAAFGGAAAHSC